MIVKINAIIEVMKLMREIEEDKSRRVCSLEEVTKDSILGLKSMKNKELQL